MTDHPREVEAVAFRHVDVYQNEIGGKLDQPFHDLHRIVQLVCLDARLLEHRGVVGGHEETKDLAIVVVSVEASRTRDRIETSALGVLDWLDKPIDHDRLLDAVRRAVSQRCNGRPRILYVEDDADLVQVIASMIGDSVEIVRAPTVGEATSILRDERFDLVLLDVNLPDGSGLDLLPLLKNGGDATTPVIIFSVDVMDEDTAARVDAALVKSRTSNRELLETMMSLIAPAMKNQSMKNKS